MECWKLIDSCQTRVPFPPPFPRAVINNRLDRLCCPGKARIRRDGRPNGQRISYCSHNGDLPKFGMFTCKGVFTLFYRKFVSAVLAHFGSTEAQSV